MSLHPGWRFVSGYYLLAWLHIVANVDEYDVAPVCRVVVGNPNQINDALLRTLEAEREGKPIPVDDGDGTASGGAAPLLDLDGGSDDPLKGKVAMLRTI